MSEDRIRQCENCAMPGAGYRKFCGECLERVLVDVICDVRQMIKELNRR